VATRTATVNVGGRRYVERVLAGYRYRAYPTPGQAALLARTFGWARVVFNDALRARQDAHAAGEKISDTQVQRKVVTLAKTTPQRQWLGGVASVALVQACQDARRGYRNWFDSLSGARKGRKVGHPRFRSRKDNRAWIRLTRNGFAVTTGGVRVAKVGDVRLVWSRVVPCRRARAVIREPAAGTTRRLWSRWQTHRYPRAPTMSESTLA
jgi:putative transposase